MKIFEIEDGEVIDAVMVEFKGGWTNIYYLHGGVIHVKNKWYSPALNLYHLRGTLDEALDNNDEVTEKIMEYIQKKLKRNE
jgi:hypothetical protein